MHNKSEHLPSKRIYINLFRLFAFISAWWLHSRSTSIQEPPFATLASAVVPGRKQR